MRELKVVDVGRVSTFCQRDDVVYRRAEGVGVLQREVDGAATNTAHGLRCVDPLPVLLELSTVTYYCS